MEVQETSTNVAVKTLRGAEFFAESDSIRSLKESRPSKRAFKNAEETLEGKGIRKIREKVVYPF